MFRRTTQYRVNDLNRAQEYRTDTFSPRRGDRHTLGSIIWLAMLRLILTMLIAWYLKDHFGDYGEWWMVTVAAIYGIAIYPAQIQYNYFKRTSRRVIEQTLCSSCRYFNAEGLHCMQLDEHVSETYLPCAGEGWEPKTIEEL